MGLPPHRQRAAGRAERAVRRRRPVGVPLHHGAAADREGHRVPGQPGGRAVTDSRGDPGAAAALRPRRRRAGHRGPGLAVPPRRRDRRRPGRPSRSTSGSTPCGPRARSRPACTCSAIPSSPRTGAGRADVDTYAVVYQLGDPGVRPGRPHPRACATSTRWAVDEGRWVIRQAALDRGLDALTPLGLGGRPQDRSAAEEPTRGGPGGPAVPDRHLAVDQGGEEARATAARADGPRRAGRPRARARPGRRSPDRRR